MKKSRKLLLTLLTTTSVISLSPPSALAANHSAENDSTDITSFSEAAVNPLYEDVIQLSDLKSPGKDQVSFAAETSKHCTSISEAVKYLRDEMTKRSETIIFEFQGIDYQDGMAKQIITEALSHTGNPIEGDYIAWQYPGWNCDINRVTQDNTTTLSFKYTITYYTTSEQEAEVDSTLENVLLQLDLENKTDYEKICDIYDYICDNVKYDYDNLEDDNYKLKYTAYAALLDKKAVCQGYAVLFYRMSLESGVDARLIPGTANGGSHGWNIVELDHKYYNLDSTWDAGKSEPEYFLKCNENFSDHVRHSDYDSEEFNAAYPMSEKDYEPSDTPPSSEDPFTDVEESDYFYDAVLWASQNQITSGTDATHFSPSAPCTRAQAVTFLWRTNGEPEPENPENLFTDIKPDDYFYKAVLWAYENGITTGLNESHFQPNDTVTRKEFVTFLWRAKGKPESDLSENPFSDVPDDSYYKTAVLWAYKNGITTGMDEAHFQPDHECVRAQVVTFLYRAYNETE